MKAQGFTLIEMMITVAIAVILLGVAVPSFQNFIINTRISSQTGDFIVDLSLARSEAVKRGSRVSVCTSTTGLACTASAWNAGWLVFTDTGNPGEIDGTDTILRVGMALKSDISLVGAPSAIEHYIQYLPTGAVLSSGSFTLCKEGYKGRIITVSNTGRVSPKETSSNCS